MRKFTKWVSILGAGLGVLALPLCLVKADDPAGIRNSGEAREISRPLEFPAGFELKTGNVDEGIRAGLAKLTERAVTKGDFNSMLAELSKPDRDRAREFKGVDQAKLDHQIDRIQQAWKMKYGKDFKIDPKIAFGAGFQIIEGNVSDPALALVNWPVPACRAEAIEASTREPGNGKAVKKEARAEKLEKGRNVALVRFPTMHGHPELIVSMVHHLPAFWRIDIPDDRSGEQIYEHLLTQLTWIADNTDQWPADMTEATRGLAYRVVAAVYGVNPTVHAKG